MVSPYVVIGCLGCNEVVDPFVKYCLRVHVVLKVGSRCVVLVGCVKLR